MALGEWFFFRLYLLAASLSTGEVSEQPPPRNHTLCFLLDAPPRPHFTHIESTAPGTLGLWSSESRFQCQCLCSAAQQAHTCLTEPCPNSEPGDSLRLWTQDLVCLWNWYICLAWETGGRVNSRPLPGTGKEVALVTSQGPCTPQVCSPYPGKNPKRKRACGSEGMKGGEKVRTEFM